MKQCDAIINLRRPSGSEKRRGFQPPWYTVFLYRCQKCGQVHNVRANSFLGKKAVPGIGGIICGSPLL